MTLINWLLAGTGFTGALSLLFLSRWLRRLLGGAPPSVDVFFSPKGGCTEAVVREINSARHEVLVQAYSFSSKPIAEALIAAKTRGVQVTVLLDKSNEAEPYSDLPLFVEQGLAPLTELLQFSIKAIGRSGDLLDVAVDHAGIALGMLATWRWWVHEP